MDRPESASKPRIAWATKTEMDQVIRSKEHLIAILQIKGRAFLPPKPFLSWDFLRKLMRSEKAYLTADQIANFYIPPRLQELPVTKLYAQVMSNPEIAKYMPDTNRPIDKAFFFTVLASKFPDFYETVMAEILKRKEVAEPEEKKIEISVAMQSLIKENIPFVGPNKKVGHFLNSGRQWGTPGPRTHPSLNLSGFR